MLFVTLLFYADARSPIMPAKIINQAAVMQAEASVAGRWICWSAKRSKIEALRFISAASSLGCRLAPLNLARFLWGIKVNGLSMERRPPRYPNDFVS